ncbi:MAG: AraC family transcriptional regulator [Burkholderiaceae bacterium]
MLRGCETLSLDGREMLLDEDGYLIVDTAIQAVTLRGTDTRADLRILVFGTESAAMARALSSASNLPGAIFLPTLRSHGDTVCRQLERVERAADAGDASFEAEVLGLMHAMLDAELRLRRRSHAITAVKPATRHELFRRILVAADFIRSRYQQPLSLDDIAAAACLSRFHLLRLFEQVHGMTPHAYLASKRRTVALRLIQQTRLGLDEIAMGCGFGTRSSLFRHLRSDLGASGRTIRAARSHPPVSYPSEEAIECSTRA